MFFTVTRPAAFPVMSAPGTGAGASIGEAGAAAEAAETGRRHRTYSGVKPVR